MNRDNLKNKNSLLEEWKDYERDCNCNLRVRSNKWAIKDRWIIHRMMPYEKSGKNWNIISADAFPHDEDEIKWASLFYELEGVWDEI